MNRKLKFAAGTALILLAAGGCHKQTGGQVVAVVNGDEITQQQLNAELRGANLPQGADKKAVLSQVLQKLVERQLLVQQAKSEGIDKSPEYLEQVRRAQDNLALNLLAAKLSKKIALPDNAAITQFISANPTLFVARKRYALDQIVFAVPANAAKIVHDLQPAHTLDDVAGVLSANGIKFTRGKGQLDSASVPPEFANRIAALPAGEPFVVPSNGRMVASVITSATTTPTPAEQAAPAAMNLLRQKAVSNAMQARLATAKSAAKIEYGEGFAPPAK